MSSTWPTLQVEMAGPVQPRCPPDLRARQKGRAPPSQRGHTDWRWTTTFRAMAGMAAMVGMEGMGGMGDMGGMGGMGGMAGLEGSRHLRVDAEASVTAPPDCFVLLAAINATEESGADALTKVTQLVASATRFAKDQGIPDDSVRTQDLLLHDWFDPSQQRVTARVASYQMEITASSVDQLGRLVAALSTELGDALQLRGIRPTISNPDPLYHEAQEQAVSKARAKAQTLANSAAVTLGPILSIEERRALGARVHPMATSAMRAQSAGQVVVPPVPIEPGALSVSAFVTIVYAIE